MTTTPDTILIAVSSFMGGGMLTMIGFVTSFTSKVNVMQETLKDATKKIDEHTKQPAACCPYHLDRENKITTLEANQKLVMREVFKDKTES